ncbi:hypothetical protein [Aquibacillus kalidii]|uniref:hypothetical protein n=1 Tax=Aquibacillus kalidii TaxID=2762597 RepID=UPI001645F2DC|nr:hypothetical protein [Aquibacillus kalidii]
MKYFRILDVSKDKIGRYLKVEIELGDGSGIIRWGLDQYTYSKLKEAVSTRYFDSLAADYRYELAPYYSSVKKTPNSSTTYLCHVRCVQGKRATSISVSCSEKFAGNMEWFQNEVSTIADIKHLEWHNF